MGSDDLDHHLSEVCGRVLICSASGRDVGVAYPPPLSPSLPLCFNRGWMFRVSVVRKPVLQACLGETLFIEMTRFPSSVLLAVVPVPLYRGMGGLGVAVKDHLEVAVNNLLGIFCATTSYVRLS